MSQSRPNVLPIYQVCDLTRRPLGTAICLSTDYRIIVNRLDVFTLGYLVHNRNLGSFVWEALPASNPHVGEVASPLTRREWLSRPFNPQQQAAPTCIRIERGTNFEVIDPSGASYSHNSGGVALFLRAGPAGISVGWFSKDVTGTVKAGNGQTCQPPQKAGGSHGQPPAGGSNHLKGLKAS